MLDAPVEIILTVEPVMVATVGSEELKVHAPGEVEVGGTTVNLPMSKVLVMIGKGPSVVTAAWAGGLIVMAMRERVRASIDPN